MASFPVVPREEPWGLKTEVGLFGGGVLGASTDRRTYEVYWLVIPDNADPLVIGRAFEAEMTEIPMTFRGTRVERHPSTWLGGHQAQDVVVTGCGGRVWVRYAFVARRLIGAYVQEGSGKESALPERFFAGVAVRDDWKPPKAASPTDQRSSRS